MIESAEAFGPATPVSRVARHDVLRREQGRSHGSPSADSLEGPAGLL